MKDLREWRAERLLTQKQLADMASVRVATIADIERRVKLPRYATVRKISDALAVDPGSVSEFADAIARRSSVQRPRSKDDRP